jgi:hypothetical protein
MTLLRANKSAIASRRLAGNPLPWAGLIAALALAGCSGTNEQASKMTSFATSENAADKAELFSVPAVQMTHIQILHDSGHYAGRRPGEPRGRGSG